MEDLAVLQPSLFPLTAPETADASHLVGQGAVYTRAWVVEMILDMVRYTDDRDLGAMLIVEPCCGDGAFLGEIIGRLVRSCRRHGRSIERAKCAVVAFELDPSSAGRARRMVEDLLMREGVVGRVAATLAGEWVRTADYLLEGQLDRCADMVVGNPPYIRLEDVAGDRTPLYRACYPTMIGRADVFVAFYEAALHQLAPGGRLGFICADRWMRNQYGAALRQMIAAGFSVVAVVEMHDAPAFDDEVSAYPAVTIIERSPQGPVAIGWVGETVRCGDGRAFAAHLATMRAGKEPTATPNLVSAVVEDWFEGSHPWPLVEPRRLALLRRLESEYPTLEESGAVVGIGVATGADRVFVTKDPNLVEPERLLPMAVAADARGTRLAWSGHYLVNPWDDEGLAVLRDFPRLHAYFCEHEDALRGRHVAKKGGVGWYRTIDRVVPGLTTRPKLYLPDLKARCSPVLDRGTTYPHHNLYYITSDAWDLEVLGGLLLSEVAQATIEAYCVRMRGGYLRFQAQYVRRLRVPRLESISGRSRDELRQAFAHQDFDLASRVAAKLFRLTPLEMQALGL